MKIQVDGTGTVNKGAELMLVAILEQIATHKANAKVIINTYSRSLNNIETDLKLLKRKLLFSEYPDLILKKIGIHIPFFSTFYAPKGVNLVFDASGFRFGDQWNHTDHYTKRMLKYYKKFKEGGCKIIFLPQAFGPFQTKQAKESAKIIGEYADIIIARESKSKEYLLHTGVPNKKVKVYTDFTNLVTGVSPANPNKYQDVVCIIPNNNMVNKTGLGKDRYISFYTKIINNIIHSGKKVILLNHEGQKDYELCTIIENNIPNNIPIISDLSAKQIKGVIGACYAVISSRYHGVASSLSQSVPCLATSWSHKYELLFNDYNQSNHILNLHDSDEVALQKINLLIDSSYNKKNRNKLEYEGENLKKEIRQMWDFIWTEVEK